MLHNKRYLFFLFASTLLANFHLTCCLGTEKEPTPQQNVLITVSAHTVKGDICPMLTGVNLSYYYDNDKMWDDGRIAKYLRKLKVGLLRYPGGCETSKFHWEKPCNHWNIDLWDPNINPQTYPPTDKYMSIDDYIRQCRFIGAEPLVGINIQSGIKYNRLKDSIGEAVRWVKYCKLKNYHVTYWYLDNEPYYKHNCDDLTAQDYVRCIKQFVPALKAVDPDIKIIAGWDSLLSDPRYWAEHEYLISQTHEYIDIIDLHFYWAHGYCTWDLWLKDNPMKVRQWCRDCPKQRYVGPSFAREIQGFYQKVKSIDPHIKLASLEWNIAPNKNARFSRFQHALMQAEMLTQFVRGGLYMACIWPLSWEPSGIYGQMRSVLDQQKRQPTPSFYVFKLFSNVLGQKLLQSSSDQVSVPHFSALSQDGKTLWVFLLNKNGPQQKTTAVIYISGFTASRAHAVSLSSQDISKDICELNEIPVNLNPTTGKWQTTLPPFSLTMLSFQ